MNALWWSYLFLFPHYADSVLLPEIRLEASQLQHSLNYKGRLHFTTGPLNNCKYKRSDGIKNSFFLSGWDWMNQVFLH